MFDEKKGNNLLIIFPIQLKYCFLF